MSRRRRAEKRTITPDTKYGDKVISKLIRTLMWDGKYSVVEKIVYRALEGLKYGDIREADKVFHFALNNIRPEIEVCSRRVGGATYQVPVEIKKDRSTTLALRWLILAARKRSARTMQDRLRAELLDACQNRGGAVKKREDTHKMAEANRAFAHYRW